MNQKSVPQPADSCFIRRRTVWMIWEMLTAQIMTSTLACRLYWQTNIQWKQENCNKMSIPWRVHWNNIKCVLSPWYDALCVNRRGFFLRSTEHTPLRFGRWKGKNAHTGSVSNPRVLIGRNELWRKDVTVNVDVNKLFTLAKFHIHRWKFSNQKPSIVTLWWNSTIHHILKNLKPQKYF